MKNQNLHCDEVLIPNIEIINASEHVKLAVLNIMNDEIFKNKGKDIKTLAEFPIYGGFGVAA